MNGSQRSIFVVEKLPYDYEVEWIGRNDSSQYIDTGVKLTAQSKYEIVIPEYTYGTGYGEDPRMGGIFGLRNDIGVGEFYLVALDDGNNNSYLRYAYGPTSNRFYAWEKGEHLTGKQFVAKCDGNKVYLNGVLRATLKPAQINTGNITASLFAIHAEDQIQSKRRNFWSTDHLLKISSCKIWDENWNLQRDFIPVVKDGVGYMYDKVEGKLYANLGNGQFTIGPKI